MIRTYSKEWSAKNVITPIFLIIILIIVYSGYITNFFMRNPAYSLIEVTISFLVMVSFAFYFLNQNKHDLIFSPKSILKKNLIFGKTEIKISEIESIRDVKRNDNSFSPLNLYGYVIKSRFGKSILISLDDFQENQHELREYMESIK